MNKKMNYLEITIALCALTTTTHILSSSSRSESNFSRQWGAMGTLHQAPTYFTTYQPNKAACGKKKRTPCEPSNQARSVETRKKG